MANILDVILKTIGDVQQKNQQNSNVETADPSVFDILRNKLQDIDQKTKNNQLQKGKRSPKSILDVIRGGIEGARRENKKDPKVATAPKSIFDDILKKVDAAPQRQAKTGIRKIISDYNLDASHLPDNVLNEIQNKYSADVKHMNQQYAQAIFDVAKKMK